MTLTVIDPADEAEVIAWETGTDDGLRRPLIGTVEAEQDIHYMLVAWVMEETP